VQIVPGDFGCRYRSALELTAIKAMLSWLGLCYGNRDRLPMRASSVKHASGQQQASVVMRKPVGIVIATVMVATGLFAASPPAALSQAMRLVVVDVQAVAEGYRVSKLMGSTVVNDHKDEIGTIDDIVVSRDRVLFAILQVGGFLGLGGRLVAVPYKDLVLDDPSGKIVLPGASRDELKKLPEFQYRT
jgi:hypothetical protein